MRFSGSRDQLLALVDQLGIPCHWEHKGAFELCVFEDDRGNLKLNWWPETGVVQLVGDPEVRVTIQSRLQALLQG